MGSSFLPGELIAAFLWAQLEEADRITKERLASWQRYHEFLKPLEAKGILRRPIVPDDFEYNAHMYYILLAPEIDGHKVLDSIKCDEIWSVFHYVPLHSSPAGKRYCRSHVDLDVTNQQYERLVRLPMWVGLSDEQQNRVVEVLCNAAA